MSGFDLALFGSVSAGFPVQQHDRTSPACSPKRIAIHLQRAPFPTAHPISQTPPTAHPRHLALELRAKSLHTSSTELPFTH